MRLSDFWERMDLVLGAGYSRSWAHDQVLAELGGRTVEGALADGEDAKWIWGSVCQALEVPSQHR